MLYKPTVHIEVHHDMIS